MSDPPFALVVTTTSGRRFGIRRDPARVEGMPGGPGVPVLVDLDGARELGQVGGSCHPFLADLDGVRQIIFAGTQDLPEQAFSVVNDQHVRVCNGVWLTFPQPFREGMAVSFSGLDARGHELFRIESPPLRSDNLRAIFGPSWTTYASEP